MSLVASAIDAVERFPLPDAVTRAGIDLLVGRTRRRLAASATLADQDFVAAMPAYAVAEHADHANRQHYELPPEFFGLVLGPRRKYSCCLYRAGVETLAEAELAALEETLQHADLHDGQAILELGCGWGSLSLLMAERFPRATITAVSNSKPQRRYIMAEAAARGLANLAVITADMNVFAPPARYDRIVSVEMFEHMSNWSALLSRARDWLHADGALFLHVFSHRAAAYRFDTANDADWIARHFFTGGIMPSHRLIYRFGDLFTVEDEWQWSGTHYQRTAEDWLRNFDANLPAIDAVLHKVYGAEAVLWRRRWRLFFLATAGLFGHAGGREWGVSHYRLRPRPPVAETIGG
ncbi:MAG TPA: cyclopropane-fatty-acyl-phospholipid synthase family protein [Devosiaceae bacterium]|jgi:cyclopropane-fatty-acyl-phospholipid synthase